MRCTLRAEARLMREARLDFYELPGEDLTTSVLPEVAGWISIYEELASVLGSVLARANGSAESAELRNHLEWIELRLAAWRDRHAELAGVVIDRSDHTLTYGGETLRLTRRGADLPGLFLLPPQPPLTRHPP